MNNHPLAMFEIMATDPAKMKEFYRAVFNWEFTSGSNDFNYIKFPESPPASYPILGGIGKARADTPGFEAGTAFYLRVECVTATLNKAANLGAEIVLKKTEFDEYTIGMFKDPEHNLIGIIEPFTS